MMTFWDSMFFYLRFTVSLRRQQCVLFVTGICVVFLFSIPNHVSSQATPTIETLAAVVNNAENTALVRGHINERDNWSVFFVLAKREDTPAPLPGCNSTPSQTVFQYELPGTYHSGDEFSFELDSLVDGESYYFRACGRNDPGNGVAVQGAIKLLTLGMDGLPGDEEVIEEIEFATTSEEVEETITEPEPPVVEPVVIVEPPTRHVAQEPSPEIIPEPESLNESIPAASTSASSTVIDVQSQEILEAGIDTVTDIIAQDNQNGVLSVVIDQRVQAVFPNETGNYEYQTQFGSAESVEILVPGIALGIEAGAAIIIAITQQEPKRGVLPDQTYDATMQTQYMYDIRAFLQDGTEVTQFNKIIELVLAVPDILSEQNSLGVYFVNETQQQWERVQEVTFKDKEARFFVDHLTIFAIWQTTNQQNIMMFDDGFVNCRLLLGFVPWCAPWIWGYGAVFMIACILISLRYRQNNYL